MLLFANSVRYPYDILKTIQSVIYKYPNDYATHVVSVDTLSSSIIEPTPASPSSSQSDALCPPVVRLERLICVRQSAPKWVAKICGGSLDNYVREVTFITPPGLSAASTSDQQQQQQLRPAILQASTNLSIRNIVTCDERISYTAAVDGGADQQGSESSSGSVFAQKAFIRAQGKFHEGEVMSWLGKKIEQSSWERFDSNATIGQQGFSSVLQRMWGDP